MADYRNIFFLLATLLFAPVAVSAKILEPSVVVNMGVLKSLTATPAPASKAFTAPAEPAKPAALMAASAPRQEAPQQLAMLTPPEPSRIQPQMAAPAPAAMAAEAPPLAIRSLNRGYIEAGGNYHSVSDGLGDWSGGYLLGEWQANARNRMNAEVSYLSRFDDEGTYFAVGDTFTINDRWHASLNVGASTDGFFLPKYRVDATLYRKWLADKRLVTSLGYTDYKAREIYHDRAVSVGAIYYFDAPWIVEGGVRYNTSSPGSVDSFSQFIAITQGTYKQHFITARYGFGDESYQIIAPGNPISDFSSDEISLTWKQWLADDWGFNIRGEGYDNPSYDRVGMSVGIFKEF